MASFHHEKSVPFARMKAMWPTSNNFPVAKRACTAMSGREFRLARFYFVNFTKTKDAFSGEDVSIPQTHAIFALIMVTPIDSKHISVRTCEYQNRISLAFRQQDRLPLTGSRASFKIQTLTMAGRLSLTGKPLTTQLRYYVSPIWASWTKTRMP
ncbi:uncharacterized protein BT62DRAFT_431103 [Guyanagaster necrorhizus]|uniref:Uncharacterized protein n=1 Tax=Guyanagaster necrorhizus TaxID=856835 RepID=A0A9P7W1E4_9AGAR|nr:uncharacterized protein BT62DRAFT_431103 [Guyanagaster necrorhizus MCA 3950]KAG7451531.1 hypothetical protein BT62DRAFT_431103 [Guyanagaster necrorhizus MCA 3950]